MPSTAYSPTKDESLLHFGESDSFETAAPSTANPPRRSAEDDSSFHSLEKPHSEMEDKVKEAEKELEALQRKREQLERERAELQRLRARRQRFTEGKDEVAKMLNGMLPELREEAEKARRRSEFLRQMREVFSKHLEVLETVDPDEWSEAETKVELDRGESLLADARTELERFEERLSHFAPDVQSAPRPRAGSSDADFVRWMKMGFAFALPAMVFTAFILILTYLIVSQ